MSEKRPIETTQQSTQEAYILGLEHQVRRMQREIVALSQIALEVRETPQDVGRDPIEEPRPVNEAESDTDGKVCIDEAARIELFKIMAMSLQLTRVPIVMRFSYFRKRHQLRLVNALKGAGLIDVNWYKQTYPACTKSGVDPAFYFVTEGIASGHAPHPQFVTKGAK